MDPHRIRARQLRKNPTDAERVLWQKHRFWQVEGLKFRRQQPLGPYIVDFVCLEKRLVIEVDGGQHAENANYDKERDAWLHDQEFVVLRFWNHDVLRRIDEVMNVIIEKLQSTPTSILPSKGEGGRCQREEVLREFCCERFLFGVYDDGHPYLTSHRSRR
jgi:very-short-patch-repair endonuclease